jgi:uridylate kinase
MPLPTYPRVLLKLSGEALGSSAIKSDNLEIFAKNLLTIQQENIELGVVIGGGNWLRGRESEFMDRVVADQLGMYATIMNGLAVSSKIRELGGKVEVMSAQLAFPTAGCSAFDYVKARELLSEGVMIIFVGGTGNPFFSTDSAAALRGVQIKADILLKATKHDGVYDKDPAKYSEAKLHHKISYPEVIAERLEVMDLTAFDLCHQHKLPIRVFNMNSQNAVINIAYGEEIGTLIN